MWPWNESSFSPADAEVTSRTIAAAPSSPTRSHRRATSGLLVEANREAVAILNLVLLSFEPQPAAIARRLLASRLEQLVPGDHLGADEALGEIAVDLAGCRHRPVAALDRPGTDFILADREERDQSEQLVAGADH